METSAKQPINVDEAFYSVVREIRKYNKVRAPVCVIERAGGRDAEILVRPFVI